MHPYYKNYIFYNKKRGNSAPIYITRNNYQIFYLMIVALVLFIDRMVQMNCLIQFLPALL